VAARPADTEVALLVTYLSSAAAGGAHLRLGPRFGATAIAGTTPLVKRNLDFGLDSESRFLKADFQVVEKIIPSFAAPSLLTATENVAENILENITKRSTATETEPGGAAAIQAGMAELVVLNPFLRVGQYFVRLGNRFEFLFGLFVPLIFVRMVLYGQFAVGLLYFGFGSIPMNSQHLIVIALFPVCHSCSL
jgi:hypothetical protein